MGSGYERTIEPADRLNAKRLKQLHRDAVMQIPDRDGIVWNMVEQVLLDEDLTLVTNEPNQESV